MHDRFIGRFRWPSGIEEKVFVKHGLSRDDVEESFFYPKVKVARSGDRRIMLTRTLAGQYIMVVFALEDDVATVITARPMTISERRRFVRK